MSAFCCTNGFSVVNGTACRRPLPSITARPTPAEKECFAALAAQRGVSESTLALIAIRALLESNSTAPMASKPVPQREPATDRITIRLRPGDGRLIDERAVLRGMKASTYLAALIRAHVSANPPLAANELLVLKRAVAILAALNRVLAQISRTMAATGSVPRDLQQDITRARIAVAGVEKLTCDLAKAALLSWEATL